jgi:hypothetical protein
MTLSAINTTWIILWWLLIFGKITVPPSMVTYTFWEVLCSLIISQLHYWSQYCAHSLLSVELCCTALNQELKNLTGDDWLTYEVTHQLTACSSYKHITLTESSSFFTCDLSLSCQPIDFLNIPDGMRGKHRPGNMTAPSSTPIILLMQYETCGT